VLRHIAAAHRHSLARHQRSPAPSAAAVADEWPTALWLATLLEASAIVEPKFPESVKKMSDDRQNAPATMRNLDFILVVLRDVVRRTGVILEIARARASISSISPEISRLSFSKLPILIRMPCSASPRGRMPQAWRASAHP
jgi:hypothetical protein